MENESNTKIKIGDKKMGNNTGVTKADRTKKGDETYTPYYAVDPIIKYLKEKSKIWCPFDKEWSAFVKVLQEAGHEVVFTHLEKDGDFFKFDKEFAGKFDYIISNPPYTIKDDILKRLYELEVPFMMLLPVNTLQGIGRGPLFVKHQPELLCFDARINFHKKGHMKVTQNGAAFGSGYICNNVLPEKLVLEILKKDKRPLIGGKS